MTELSPEMMGEFPKPSVEQQIQDLVGIKSDQQQRIKSDVDGFPGYSLLKGIYEIDDSPLTQLSVYRKMVRAPGSVEGLDSTEIGLRLTKKGINEKTGRDIIKTTHIDIATSLEGTDYMPKQAFDTEQTEFIAGLVGELVDARDLGLLPDLSFGLESIIDRSRMLGFRPDLDTDR